MKSATYEVTRLDNGVTIATAEMPHMESVCLGFWARVGSRYEAPRQNGIAHFVEHLLFKGTPTRDAYQISREIEGHGASVDAFTTEDHTCYYTRGPREKLPELADVMIDLFCRPTFDPVEIEREREVILEEIAMYRDNPSQHVEDLLGSAAWPNHPMGRPITGTEASVVGIRRGDIFSLHQQCYSGENVVITAAGNVTHQELVDMVAPTLQYQTERERAIFDKVPSGMRDNGPRREEETREVEQSHLSIGFHCCSRNDMDRYPLKVMNVLLGENMSSRLFQVLREEHGLCYNVFSDALTLDETGMLSIYVGLDLSNVSQALDLVEQVLKEFKERTAPDDLMAQAKNYTIGQSRVALESTMQQMMWIGESLVAWDRIIDPEESFSRLREVTARQVREVAQATFRTEGTALAYIGSEVPDLALDEFLG